MQNIKPTHFSVVADRSSAISDILDRVAGIAPAPLLPGEQEAEYATLIARIVAVAQPRKEAQPELGIGRQEITERGHGRAQRGRTDY